METFNTESPVETDISSVKTLSAILENFPSEKKDSLSATLSVYIDVFSNPPFSEPWIEKDKEEKMGWDEIKKLVSSCINNPEKVSFTKEPDNESVEYLIYEERKIKTVYPFRDIVEAYVEDINNPKSLVLLMYKDKEGKVVVDNLSGHNGTVSFNKEMHEPLAINRSSMKILKEGRGVQKQMKDEISHYAGKKLEEILKEIDDNKPLLYLGEIAKREGEEGENENVFLSMGSEIIKALKNGLPEQIFYFTKPGSGVDLRENNPITAIITRAYGRKYENFDPKQFNVKTSEGESYFYLYKPIKSIPNDSN